MPVRLQSLSCMPCSSHIWVVGQGKAVQPLIPFSSPLVVPTRSTHLYMLCRNCLWWAVVPLILRSCELASMLRR